MEKVIILREYCRDPWTQYTFGVSLLLSTVSSLALLLWLPDGTRIPLHYNVYFGVDFVGAWYRAFAIPAAVLGLVVVNFLFGFFVWQRDVVISRFLAVGTLALAAVATLSTFLVLLFNV